MSPSPKLEAKRPPTQENQGPSSLRESKDRVAEILRKVRRLEIQTRRRVETAFAGRYHSAFKGRGMNFEEVREYEAGDEIRTIDWNVTARTGRAHVKRYTEERELSVIFVVDVSASGSFGSVDLSKRELAAEAASILAFSASRNGDKVGLILFTDRVELYLPPRKSRSDILRLVREVLFFRPVGRGTDPAVALQFLNRVHARSTVVFLVSDFAAPDFSRAFAVTARRHDLVAVPVVDPIEEAMPDLGLINFEDPETGEEVEIQTGSESVRRAFRKEAERRSVELDKLCKRHRVDRIPLRTDGDSVGPLRAFFRKREQRRLME